MNSGNGLSPDWRQTTDQENEIENQILKTAFRFHGGQWVKLAPTAQTMTAQGENWAITTPADAWFLVSSAGPWFNIMMMSSYRYRKSHCGDKTATMYCIYHIYMFIEKLCRICLVLLSKRRQGHNELIVPPREVSCVKRRWKAWLTNTIQQYSLGRNDLSLSQLPEFGSHIPYWAIFATDIFLMKW